jgi:catalase
MIAVCQFVRSGSLYTASRFALPAIAIACSMAAARAADPALVAQKPFPVAIVDTLNTLSGGPHAGYRANHAKGILVTGEFTPAPTAPGLSKAPHFAKAVPVLIRLSDPTGVPTLPDADPNASPHGMAIRFQLPGGDNTDIVSISADTFPVATPEEFLGLLQAVAASGPGAAKPSPIEQFLGSHPIAAKWLATPRPAPVSFGTLAYFGINAFKFTNSQGVSRYARYQILPVAGQKSLSGAEASAAAPNYLMDELPQRIGKGAVKFRLVAQIAKANDPVNDGSIAWPADRELIELGTLSMTAMSPEQFSTQKMLLFNPLLLQDGIEPSADPVLLARPGAYAISYGQRVK